MAHHSDQHVDEDDDDGDVVQRKQERADALDDRRRRVATREADRVLAAVFLRRVLDLDTVDVDKPEHRPEQAEQRPRQPTTNTAHQSHDPLGSTSLCFSSPQPNISLYCKITNGYGAKALRDVSVYFPASDRRLLIDLEFYILTSTIQPLQSNRVVVTLEIVRPPTVS